MQIERMKFFFFFPVTAMHFYGLMHVALMCLRLTAYSWTMKKKTAGFFFALCLALIASKGFFSVVN